MRWKLELAKAARRDIDRLPPRDLDRVLAAFVEMEINPFARDVISLSNYRYAFRRRVGNYRILFDIDRARQMILSLRSEGEQVQRIVESVPSA